MISIAHKIILFMLLHIQWTKSYKKVTKNPFISSLNAIYITIKVQHTVLIKMFLQTIFNMSRYVQ